MSGYFTESNYENAVLQLLNEELGYNYVYGPDVERDYHSPLYEDVLLPSLRRINKNLPMDALTEAIYWYSVAVGSSECQISIDLVNKEHKIRVGLWIADNKERFDYMKQHKTEIEAAMGMALSWERLDNKKSSLICTYIKGLDFKNQENYPELMNKSIDLVVKMRDVLKEYVLAEL